MRKKTCNFIFILTLLFICFTGCATNKGAGDESLVESRIITAVNAERIRWAAELGQELNIGLREVDGKINDVGSGLEQIATASREYREFVLKIIDRLQQLENTQSEINNNTGSNNSGIGCVGY